MKQFLAIALFATSFALSFSAFANPAIDAAAMEAAGEQRVTPDRRQVSGQVILGVEDYNIPEQGLEVTVPAADAYPQSVVEEYPAK